MGFVGWRLGGYRLALLFIGSIVLLAAALYWYADRIAMGMVGARELMQGEAPALHSAVETLSGRAAVIRPRLYILGDGYPRALVAGRAAARRSRCRPGCSQSRRRPSSRGSWRTSLRTCAGATSSFRRLRS